MFIPTNVLNKSFLSGVGYCCDDTKTLRFEYEDPDSLTIILSIICLFLFDLKVWLLFPNVRRSIKLIFVNALFLVIANLNELLVILAIK